MPVPRLAKTVNSVLGHSLNLRLNEMTAPLKAIDGNADLAILMNELGTQDRAAARVLSLASPEQKDRALAAMERAIRANAPAILAANAEDVTDARASGVTGAFIDA
jgi:glutamate-5-semialdehyde dehydrogenase